MSDVSDGYFIRDTPPELIGTETECFFWLFSYVCKKRWDGMDVGGRGRASK